MEKNNAVQRVLRELFSTQNLAVLATSRQGAPYCSLVAITVTEDLKHLLFATSRSTRKYANLSADSRAAFLIDSRSNRVSDFQEAVAVTITGRAEAVEEGELEEFQALHLSRHPNLKEFIMSSTCALLKLRVDSYIVVQNFQDVTELRME